MHEQNTLGHHEPPAFLDSSSGGHADRLSGPRAAVPVRAQAHLQCGEDLLSQLLTCIGINVCEGPSYPPLQPVGINLLWVQPLFPLILSRIRISPCLHFTHPPRLIITLVLLILQCINQSRNHHM